MNDKLYIKKLIRDDGETLAFDGKEIYLAERNTLLVRPDPRTAAVDYTEADGGEMIHQQNQTYPQTISGLIVPKTTDYWQLVNKLSAFFKIKHNYKIIYQKRSGEMFMIQGAWISAGLQIIPRPHEDYSEWDITLTVGNLTWVEYMENSAGEQIYPNTVTLSLITLASGGEVWDNVGAEWSSVEGTINSIQLNGNTEQASYSGKNLFNGSKDAIAQIARGTATVNGNGFTLTSTASSGAVYATIPIPNIESLLGKEVTFSFNGSGDGIIIRLYYLTSNNTADSVVGINPSNTPTFTFPETLGSYSGIGVVCYTSTGGSATYKDMQLELGSTATSYEPYVGGTASPNPDYPQNVETATGEQTITISNGNESQTYTVNLGSIELYKIGDYQDYIYKQNGSWYLHKEITKTTLPSSGWQASGQTLFTDVITDYATSNNIPVCTHFEGATNAAGAGSAPNNKICFWATESNTMFRLYVKYTSKFTTVSEFEAWLASNSVDVYYRLATPTDTQITDSALVAQLEALASGNIYGESAIISVTSSGLPAILEKTTIPSINGGEVWEAGEGGVEDINISSSQTIYPVWTVKGPCVNPRLQNNTTDSLAEFNGTLAENQTLVVDFAEGTAYLDNALVTRLLSGEVSFAPGENVVSFSSDGGATTTSTISWANIIN